MIQTTLKALLGLALLASLTACPSGGDSAPSADASPSPSHAEGSSGH